jgi:HEAT repeat protein
MARPDTRARGGLWHRLKSLYGGPNGKADRVRPGGSPANGQAAFLPEELLREWQMALKHSHLQVRRAAASAFHPSQLMTQNPRSPVYRWRALWPHIERDPADTPIVETVVLSLTEALGDEDGMVRESAAEVLGCIPSETAVPALAKVLRHKHVGVRRSAVKALAEASSGSAAAAPALAEALADSDAHVRAEAARALGRTASQAAVPALMYALKDESVEVRRWATRALGSIRNLASAPALMEALKDRDVGVRRTAAQVLGHLRAQGAVPALAEALLDASGPLQGGDVTDVRCMAAWALGETHNPQAAPALERALHDKNALVRDAATKALAKVRGLQAAER